MPAASLGPAVPKQSLASRLGNALRTKKSIGKLRKRTSGEANSNFHQETARDYKHERDHAFSNGNRNKLTQERRPSKVSNIRGLAPLQAHRVQYNDASQNIDTQLGENRDYTSMLHALGLNEGVILGDLSSPDAPDSRPPGDDGVASLSPELWAIITSYLNPMDAACLAVSSRTLLGKLGPRLFDTLNLPSNYDYKIAFLNLMDKQVPHHLLCFPCAQYHIRIQEGQEKLQPASVLNPLFECPNVRNVLKPQPRHRITHGRTLPFPFVQLVTRAHRHGSLEYGITTESLARRYRRERWNNASRYYLHEGHLLMRVTSWTFAEPGLPISAQRLLLYDRDDYWPYFSVCSHWRDGELMNVCKCVLGHIPVPRDTGGLQGMEHKIKDTLHGRVYNPTGLTRNNGKTSSVASLCSFCQPIRRCPKCPTEYLVEVKLVEDKLTPNNIDRYTASFGGKRPLPLVAGVLFRHAVIVTRWSDLGPGITPSDPEWAANNGTTESYDSFKEIGKRSLAGIFEAAFTHDTLPPRRIISLNPTMMKAEEDGGDWY